MESLRQSVEEIQSHLHEQLELSNQTRDEQNRLATESLAELQAAVQQATTDLNQLQAAISRQESRLDTALTAHQQAFTNAETDRLTQHQEAIKTARIELESALSEAVTDSEVRLASQEESGKQVLSRLRTLEDQARDVVGAVAATSTSTGYGKHADQQGRTADWLRGIAIVLILAAFAITGYSVYIVGTEDESWKVTSIKAVTSVTLVAAAGYAARESSEHRKQEIKARNTQLKLVALDPFIANLEKEDREQIKIATTRHLFIEEHDHEPSTSTETDTA